MMTTFADAIAEAPIPPGSTTANDGPIPTPFPARSQTKASTILNMQTTATCLHFSDKILLTISQNGRLGHWMHVPLTPSQTASLHASIPTDPENALLPDPQITATTILGGTIPALDLLGQTLATHLATAIMSADRHENRMLVLGLGLDRKMENVVKAGGDGGVFAELVGLGLDVVGG